MTESAPSSPSNSDRPDPAAFLSTGTPPDPSSSPSISRVSSSLPTPPRSTPISTATKRIVKAGLAGRFNKAPYTLEQILKKTCVTDEDARAKMSAKERTAFHASIIQGMDTKFTIKNDLSILHDGTTTSDFMEKNLSFNLQVRALQHYLESKCLHSVFSILNISPNKPGELYDENTVYLLQDYTSINIDQVLLSSEFYYKYSSKPLDQENLEWTMDLLLNSCDAELQKIVQSKLMMLPRTQRGGPTTFMLIVTQIIHSNDNIARSLTSRLDTYKVTAVPGENIETVSAYISALCDRLECCGKLPHDIEKMVLTILDSCTVTKFANHFNTLRTIESHKLSDYHGVLREATRFYLQLIHDGDWLPSTKPGSAFMVAPPTQIPRPGSQDRTHDRKGNLIDRSPPTGGAPSVRSNSTGSTESWCSDCNRWGNHPSPDHAAWKLRQKEFRRKAKAALAAADSPAPESADKPAPPPVSGVTQPSSNLAAVERLLRSDV